MRSDAISKRVVPITGVRNRSFGQWSLRIYRWVKSLRRLAERRPRRLRLCESLALGERRFVAVIEFERRRFLVGGAGQSLVLLTKLDDRGQENSGEQEQRQAIAEQSILEQSILEEDR